MTSSFGITPQRQIRDLVANPEQPVSLPVPAQPAQTPKRVGGQLFQDCGTEYLFNVHCSSHMVKVGDKSEVGSP